MSRYRVNLKCTRFFPSLVSFLIKKINNNAANVILKSSLQSEWCSWSMKVTSMRFRLTIVSWTIWLIDFTISCFLMDVEPDRLLFTGGGGGGGCPPSGPPGDRHVEMEANPNTCLSHTDTDSWKWTCHLLICCRSPPVRLSPSPSLTSLLSVLQTDRCSSLLDCLPHFVSVFNYLLCLTVVISCPLFACGLYLSLSVRLVLPWSQSHVRNTLKHQMFDNVI